MQSRIHETPLTLFCNPETLLGVSQKENYEGNGHQRGELTGYESRRTPMKRPATMLSMTLAMT